MRFWTLATALAAVVFAAAIVPAHAADKLKVLIVDGQNNHDWVHTTPVLKWILEDSGRFTVDVSTAPPSLPNPPGAPKATASPEQVAAYQAAMQKFNDEKAARVSAHQDAWKAWHPKFSDYNVIVSNYNGEDWPESVRTDFVDFVRNGGGFVSVHAADNSFPNWPEYNEMIGVGGWGGRNEKSGPMIRFRDGQIVQDTTPGAGGMHGRQHEFLVETRDADHPIMKGLPLKWMHASDELYSKLRGPAKDVIVLATAFAGPDMGGTSENEPMLMVINYGKGRVFHTTLGHSPQAMNGLGFQITLDRGTEWAATGEVTFPAPKPEDLPADKAAMHPMPK